MEYECSYDTFLFNPNELESETEFKELNPIPGVWF